VALLIRGASSCPICNQVIQVHDDVISFPPFIPNEFDPLYLFHDANFHRDCFLNHPFANAATKRYEELETHHQTRIDVITNTPITDPDDYFMLGHLTDDATDPLYRYNYLHLRRSKLSNWTDLEKVYRLIKALDANTVRITINRLTNDVMIPP